MSSTYITEEQAQAALEAVKKQFAPYMEPGYGPVLERDYHWLDKPTPWAVVWEMGPYQWACAGPGGGLNEEASFALGKVVMFPEAPDWPEQVWAEAVTGWCLALHPDPVVPQGVMQAPVEVDGPGCLS